MQNSGRKIELISNDKTFKVLKESYENCLRLLQRDRYLSTLKSDLSTVVNPKFNKKVLLAATQLRDNIKMNLENLNDQGANEKIETALTEENMIAVYENIDSAAEHLKKQTLEWHKLAKKISQNIEVQQHQKSPIVQGKLTFNNSRLTYSVSIDDYYRAVNSIVQAITKNTENDREINVNLTELTERIIKFISPSTVLIANAILFEIESKLNVEFILDPKSGPIIDEKEKEEILEKSSMKEMAKIQLKYAQSELLNADSLKIKYSNVANEHLDDYKLLVKIIAFREDMYAFSARMNIVVRFINQRESALFKNPMYMPFSFEYGKVNPSRNDMFVDDAVISIQENKIDKLINQTFELAKIHWMGSSLQDEKNGTIDENLAIGYLDKISDSYLDENTNIKVYAAGLVRARLILACIFNDYLIYGKRKNLETNSSQNNINNLFIIDKMLDEFSLASSKEINKVSKRCLDHFEQVSKHSKIMIENKNLLGNVYLGILNYQKSCQNQHALIFDTVKDNEFLSTALNKFLNVISRDKNNTVNNVVTAFRYLDKIHNNNLAIKIQKLSNLSNILMNSLNLINLDLTDQIKINQENYSKMLFLQMKLMCSIIKASFIKEGGLEIKSLDLYNYFSKLREVMLGSDKENAKNYINYFTNDLIDSVFGKNLYYQYHNEFIQQKKVSNNFFTSTTDKMYYYFSISKILCANFKNNMLLLCEFILRDKLINHDDKDKYFKDFKVNKSLSEAEYQFMTFPDYVPEKKAFLIAENGLFELGKNLEHLSEELIKNKMAVIIANYQIINNYLNDKTISQQIVQLNGWIESRNIPEPTIQNSSLPNKLGVQKMEEIFLEYKKLDIY